MLFNKEILIIGTANSKSNMLSLAKRLDGSNIVYRTPVTDFVENNFLQTEIFSMAIVFGDTNLPDNGFNLVAERNKLLYMRQMKYGGLIVYVTKHLNGVEGFIKSDPDLGEVELFPLSYNAGEISNLDHLVEIIKQKLGGRNELNRVC